MLDSDAREAGLQHELKSLQRLRPVRSRFRDDVDTTLWDPLERGQDDEELQARWRAAAASDDLLRRVTRRDPDDVASRHQRLEEDDMSFRKDETFILDDVPVRVVRLINRDEVQLENTATGGNLDPQGLQPVRRL
ncbi:MAG: hypothetical protein MZW92_07690 [Comamonadaceae bacterium]|nr:hypothetical protein [Comamonadaceae bacterium]